MESQGGLSVERMCGLTKLSRASFYRQLEAQALASLDQKLRDVIQRASLAHRFYGYRRIAQVLRQQGRPVTAKKVRRLMQEDNLPSARGSSLPPRIRRVQSLLGALGWGWRRRPPDRQQEQANSVFLFSRW